MDPNPLADAGDATTLKAELNAVVADIAGDTQDPQLTVAPDDDDNDNTNGNVDKLAEADGEDRVEGEEEGGGDGDDEEGYAAEYRSLLFRVADMETQEEQRARRNSFALRMAQREAQLMSRVVRQQQVFLASRASTSASPPTTTTTTTKSSMEKAEAQLGDTSCELLTSSGAIAQTMQEDARLLCLAYRAELARQRRRQVTEATAHLTAHTHAVQQDMQFIVQLREVTGEVEARLAAETGVEFSFMTSTAAENNEEGTAQLLPLSPAAADTWQRHNASLCTLGGTLAKVHTLFHDADCRTNMAVVASHLTQLGRQMQQLLGEIQILTAREAQLEAALRRSRGYTVEWSVYAAHAQQAREMRDICSAATVAEMRAMAVRKLLLRRRQELQNALTVTLLREAERSVTLQTPPCGALSITAPAISFSSPAADVTAEQLKASADECARREAVRDRLWRELLFLKRCARRELGVAWVARLEAAAVRNASVVGEGEGRGRSSDGDDARRLSEVLTDKLRASTYDGVARVLRIAAAQPPQTSTSTEAADDGDHLCLGDEKVANVGDDSQAVVSPSSTPHSPRSPTASYPPRVRVLALLESVQTRANSLTSLLLENAKHWQRVLDVRTEVECGCGGGGSRDEAWSRTAEVLLRRCSSSGGDNISAEDAESNEAHPSSFLLEIEQDILNTFSCAESQILADMNAAFAQVHRQCTTPLQHTQREVAVLVRLLQLSDEALLPASDDSVTPSVGCAKGTRTTPALENAMQLLAAESDARVSCGSSSPEKDPLDTFADLLTLAHHHKNSDARFSLADTTARPCICLPQIPQHVDTLQSAMAAVSDEYHEALRTDTAALRSAVTAKQASLEQYAQYSMADVPALLEKARAEVKKLKGQLTSCTAHSSRAAALAAEAAEQRHLLAQRTGSERRALETAVQTAEEEQAALEAEVQLLRACHAVVEAEWSGRRSTVEAESAEWTSLIRSVDDVFVKTLESVTVKHERDGMSPPPPAAADTHAGLLDASYDERLKTEEADGSAGLGETVAGGGYDEVEAEEEEENVRDGVSDAFLDAPIDDSGREAGADHTVAPVDEEPQLSREPATAEEEAADSFAGARHSTVASNVDVAADEENRFDNVSSNAALHGDEDEEEVAQEDVGEAGDTFQENNGDEDEEGSTSVSAPPAAAAAMQDEEEQQQHNSAVPPTVKLSNQPEVTPDEEEEAVLQREEKNEGRSSVLGDSVGVLGVDAASSVPPPQVLPTPPVSSTSAVLDDNPFYSGFGFDGA
jgi:hypothetical protein